VIGFIVKFLNHNLYVCSTVCKFIPMFTWIRSHQRKLMTVVAVLTIVSFVVLYNAGSLETLGRSDFARIYGRDVTMTELQREARLASLAAELGLGEYVSSLNAGENPDNSIEFVFNALVLRHEAEVLGVRPTAEEIKSAITALPVFQTNGQFDSQKYLVFSQTALAPRGFSEAQIEEVVADSIRFDRVRSLIESPVVISEAELLNTARAFQKAKGQVVVFDQSQYLKDEPISEEQIASAYERAKPQLLTPETRAVRYVTFSLPGPERTLAEPERIKALQKVADASAAFAEKAEATSFDEALKASALQATTTLDFTIQGNAVSPEGLPSAAASVADPLMALARPAFMLRRENAVTSVIQDGDNFYVAELVRETPSREMTLDEARPLILREIRLEAARARMEESAVTGLATLREALAAGNSFVAAAESAGLKLMPFDAAPADPVAPIEQRRYADAAMFLNPGELSEYVPAGAGGFAVLLESREPLSPETLTEQRPQIEQYLKNRSASILFFEWLVSARARAGVNVNADQG
jgi:peptidyl-prolyl cis-trans isomerase D